MKAINSLELKDKRTGLISSFAALLILYVLLYISTFERHAETETQPVEVLMEIPLEQYIEEPPRNNKAGGGGGGTPSNDPVDEPKPQTEKILAAKDGDVKTHSGKSDNHNSANSENTSSSTQKSDNPFSTDGGSGGGKGGGKGKGTGLGRDEGAGEGDGGGNGNNSKPRIRLNDPNNDNISSNQSCKVALKLSVNAEGDVVRAENLTSKTTTTNQKVISQVVSNVKNQVKYNKKEGASLEMVYLTVNISAK